MKCTRDVMEWNASYNMPENRHDDASRWRNIIVARIDAYSADRDSLCGLLLAAAVQTHHFGALAGSRRLLRLLRSGRLRRGDSERGGCRGGGKLGRGGPFDRIDRRLRGGFGGFELQAELHGGIE